MRSSNHLKGKTAFKANCWDGRARRFQNQKMAANDADDAYVMDLSERHLSSRGLHDALARLQRVLHDEDERDGVSVARPLELLCAGNDVAKFALPASEKPPRPEPAPRQRQPEPEPPTVESYASCTAVKVASWT